MVLTTAIIGARAFAESVDSSLSGHIRTQEISLKTGWNSVFLEVDPIDHAPNSVFADCPVEQVAAYFPGPESSQFVSDASVDLTKARGWGVWYAANRPEAFLKSLDAIYGNQPYLIKVSRAYTWKVRGLVKSSKTRWLPDSYNLVGFSMAAGAPTFAEFFAGSKALNTQPIYRLVDNAWKKVLQPAGESMRDGEAFWIYCKGSSDFQGPLRVEPPIEQGVILQNGVAGITIRNESLHPIAPKMEQLVGEASGVPLSFVVQTIGDPAKPVRQVGVKMPTGAWSQSFPTLEIDESMSVPLECRTLEMTAPIQSSLLKITSDIGTVIWIPVKGVRGDVAQ